MTAYARTLLNQTHAELNEENNADILACLGGLKAHCVASYDMLDESARALAMMDDDETSDDDIFIVVRDAQFQQDVLALCRLNRSHRENGQTGFHTTGLVDHFEIVVKSSEPSFLKISPFHFSSDANAHRAQGLLWQAIANYCLNENIDYVVGSMAFNSRYPAAHALELSYLHHFCRAESTVRAKAVNGVTMDIMPEEAIKQDEAFSTLPPMLRYCLRLGAKVAEGAVVDRLKNQTKIFLLFPAKSMAAA